MALSKLQQKLQNQFHNLVNQLSEKEQIKKIINDVQIKTENIQNQIKQVSAHEAIKIYKTLAKQAIETEKKLENEVEHLVEQFKNKADIVELQLSEYIKKAKEQRMNIESILQKKIKKHETKKTAKTTKKSSPKIKSKLTTKKATVKKAKK